MSTIEKKSVRSAAREDRNTVDLFKNSSTGDISYRAANGAEVVVIPAAGIQSLIDRIAVLEQVIEKLAGGGKPVRGKEAAAAINEIKQFEAAAVEAKTQG